MFDTAQLETSGPLSTALFPASLYFDFCLDGKAFSNRRHQFGRIFTSSESNIHVKPFLLRAFGH